MGKTRSVLFASVYCTLYLCGCRAEKPAFDGAAVEELIQSQRFDEALPLIKTELLRNISNAPAHFYFAQCYTNLMPLYPGLIEGELQFALNLLTSNPGADAEADRNLQFQCYLYLSHLYLYELQATMAKQQDYGSIQELVGKATWVIEQAQTIAPDDPEVKRAEPLLERLHKAQKQLPPLP